MPKEQNLEFKRTLDLGDKKFISISSFLATDKERRRCVESVDGLNKRFVAGIFENGIISWRNKVRMK